MMLIKIAPCEIVNLDAIAYVKYEDGTQPGTSAKGDVFMTVLYQSGETRKVQDHAARVLWEALQSHSQPKGYGDR
jgi:hypothetical protein